MNFTSDAIWWRLTNQHIRALASLLVAPPLWHTGCELPTRELLGETGFRYLLHLNDNESFRLPENLSHPLLGKYAENLLTFWLSSAPHSRLLGQNIKLFNSQNQSIGELDFIAELNGKIYHIELTCKYFGAIDGQPENMIGFNPEDNLMKKFNKLNNQLNYSNRILGQTLLADFGININQIKHVSIVRGMGFSHSGKLNHPLYPTNTWTGILLHNTQHINFIDKKLYRLQPNQFLAPARVSHHLITDASNIGSRSGLIAEVVQRPDGFYHEIQRFMLNNS